MTLFEHLPALDGYEVGKAIIVSPYLSSNFAEKINELWKPRNTLLITDNSCPYAEAKSFVDKFSEESKVLYAQSTGIVHVKLIYLEYEKNGLTGYGLMWGSANASDNAFFKNSESLSKVKLDKNKDKKIIQYFSLLWESKIPESIKIKLSKPTTLILPKLMVNPKIELDTFDAWLQAGRIFHQYQMPQNFLKIEVKFNKELPSSKLDKKIAGLGFDVVKKDKLSFKYLRTPSNHKDGVNGEHHWLAKNFIDTYMGRWCSLECYNNKKNLFVAKNHEQRKEEIQLLKLINKSNNKNMQEYANPFIKKLGGLKEILKSGKFSPDEYIHRKKSEYKSSALKQIKRDIDRIENHAFVNRYENGNIFERLPRFQLDSTSWEKYCVNFCENLLFESNRSGESFLGKVVSDYFPEQVLLYSSNKYDASDLLKCLRDDWLEYKDEFISYHAVNA